MSFEFWAVVIGGFILTLLASALSTWMATRVRRSERELGWQLRERDILGRQLSPPAKPTACVDCHTESSVVTPLDSIGRCDWCHELLQVKRATS